MATVKKSTTAKRVSRQTQGTRKAASNPAANIDVTNITQTPMGVEVAISLVLDVLERGEVLFIYRDSKPTKGRRQSRSLWFSAGPFSTALGPKGYAIIGNGKYRDTYREFYESPAAADCARVTVNLCGSVLAERAVSEWRDKLR